MECVTSILIQEMPPIKWEAFRVLIDLIGLITSTDFNRL